jgi:RNA polymerase sigma-70 factor (sigma-E family)
MQEWPTFGEYLAARESRLLRTAWLLTGDWQLAEDLVQTAMVRVWPRWDRVCAGGDPEAYVRTALVRTYCSWWRRRWRGEHPTAAVPDEVSDVDLGDGPFATVDLRDAIDRVLPLLPARQRAVLVLRFFEDLTEQQTADALGVTVGTVKSQANRALARLRGALVSRAVMEGER